MEMSNSYKVFSRNSGVCILSPGLRLMLAKDVRILAISDSEFTLATNCSKSMSGSSLYWDNDWWSFGIWFRAKVRNSVDQLPSERHILDPRLTIFSKDTIRFTLLLAGSQTTNGAKFLSYPISPSNSQFKMNLVNTANRRIHLSNNCKKCGKSEKCLFSRNLRFVR